MNGRIVVVAIVALGLAAAAGYWRSRPSLADVLKATETPGVGSTPETATALKAAGVHKCVGGGRTSYVDGAACPAGTREVAATGGTVTVTSFPKPSAAPASSGLGGPLVKTMDPDERDRLRDKAIDDAANRR